MGIKHFFPWYKKRFARHIKVIHPRDDVPQHIDTLGLDLNGLFHPSAQKVFQYGQQTKTLRRLIKPPKPKPTYKLEMEFFKDVCKRIDDFVDRIRPQKRLLLCVDGVAGASKCIVEGTLITLSDGTSKPIELLMEGDSIFGWDDDGFSTSLIQNLQDNGQRDTIQIIMIDGRTLVCTEDHLILVCSNDTIVWKEAGQLSSQDTIICGLEAPMTLREEDNTWKLLIDSTIFSIDTPHERQKTLALSRIIGHVMSDGSLTHTTKSKTGVMIVGTMLDATQALRDITILTGKTPSICKTVGDKGTVFSIRLPIDIIQWLLSLPNMNKGKKTTQPRRIPDFLMDKKCPISVVTEFLGALFGGDGCSPYIRKATSWSFGNIKFSQSCIVSLEDDLKKHFENICLLLDRVGVNGAYISHASDLTYTNGLMIPADNDIHPRIRFSLRLPMTSDFGDKVGFRYAVNKSLRLTVANAFWRMSENIKRSRDHVVTRAIEIYENHVPDYTCPNCHFVFTRRCSLTRHQKYRCPIKKVGDVPRSDIRIEEALSRSQHEYIEAGGIILHEKALSSVQEVCTTKTNRSLPTTTRRIRYTMDAREFIETLGVSDWFISDEGVAHIVGQEDTKIPYFTLPIKKIHKMGKKHVYDIEVNDTHSFLANGMCVHNCVQQRQRRFISARDNPSIDKFDSNSLTPGTALMDKLTPDLDWFIHKRKQDAWSGLEVVFSNEKVPGEGEHKIKLMMEQYCHANEYFCIYGLDADLIMLCLSLCRPNVFIVRDDHYAEDTRYILDVSSAGEEISTELGTESAVQDFVLMCFMVGNDFLPQIKSLEILSGGIETLLEAYKKTCRPFGLVQLSTFNIRVNTLLRYIQELALVEEDELKHKFSERHKFFPDEMMEDYFYENKGQLIHDRIAIECDLEGYKRDFYATKFPDVSIETICCEYLKGLQWVCHYYNVGIPNWHWSYPYHYAPFLTDLAKCSTYAFTPYPNTKPYDPFQQLLSVLPPKSAALIPFPLSTLLADDHSSIKTFYPDDFQVDLAGKRREWEAIVLLPMVDSRLLTQVYRGLINNVDKKDLRRNGRGKEFVYSTTDNARPLTHKHGTISQCNVVKNELQKDSKGVYRKDDSPETSTVPSAPKAEQRSSFRKVHQRIQRDRR